MIKLPWAALCLWKGACGPQDVHAAAFAASKGEDDDMALAVLAPAKSAPNVRKFLVVFSHGKRFFLCPKAAPDTQTLLCGAKCRRILCMGRLTPMWGRGGLVRPAGGGVAFAPATAVR